MKSGKAEFAIVDEFFKASKAFPKFNSAHEGYAVILEELDELWEAVKLNQSNIERSDKMKKEAIQVGAMALRFLVDCIPDEILKDGGSQDE